jgi:O-antigen ligase
MSTFQKIIEYTLYLFVFLLPFQIRYFIEKGFINGSYLEYKTVSLYASDIVLFVLITLFLIHQFPKIKKAESGHKLSVLWWLLSGLDLMVFISIFAATDHVLAVYKYVVFLLGIGLFWVLVRADYSKTKLYFSLLSALAVHAGIGMWQFLTQSDFAFSWLGMAAHFPSQAGTSVVEVAEQGGRWLRAYGGMDHPNVLGGALAVSILILMGMLIVPELRITNYELRKKNWKLEIGNWGAYLLLLLFTATLFFTFSRAAWLSLLVGCFFILAFNYIKGNRIAARQVTKLLAMMAILVTVLTVQFQDIVSSRLWGDSRLETRSAIERVESIQGSGIIIQDNLILGAGIGNYSLALEEQDPDQPGWSYQPVHNTFLLIISEIGFLGLIFFIGALSWIAAIAYRRRDYAGLSILLSLLVLMIFEHWLWSLHFGILFLWLILALIYKK